MVARLQTFAMVAILLLVVSMPLAVGYATWRDHQSVREEWAVAGPACPVVASLSLAVRGGKPPAPFSYRGAAFAYQIGDVECVAAPEKSLFDSSSYTICQFDAPAAVEVKAGGRTALFEPGLGHGATVTIRKGQISCVIDQGARFYGPGVGQRILDARGRSAAPRRQPTPAGPRA
jgi:hypothetical protein